METHDTGPTPVERPSRVQLLKVENGRVPLKPVLLNHHDAAAYLGRSVGWLRNMRSKDIQRMRAGEKPVGPGWVKVGATPMYPIADYETPAVVVRGLDTWLAKNAEPYGAGEMPGSQEVA